MSDFSFLKSWIAARPSGDPADGTARSMREEFEQFFTNIFNHSKDGISVLSLDFTILGVNTTIQNWYDPERPLVGRKCYQAYHNRDTPCRSCPSMVTIRTGRPHVGVVPYDVSGSIRGDQELSVFPLFDDNRQMFCLIEYVRDITSLEHDARIIEKLKRRIQFQDQTMQEQEAALAMLLRQEHRAGERAAREIVSNIETLVLPLLARLKHICAGAEASREIQLLESRLGEIASMNASRLSSALRGLTCREHEVVSLVRRGKTSKEIAGELCISTKAVDFHRMNIKKKIGARDSARSLRSFLLELENPR
jgi:DNA-binding CsgD family transcriptional regulator